jgi:hypothetical protein
VTTGRIGRILYDCFGSFEGFVVETCTGQHTFTSCERGIEAVALRACRARLKVLVRHDGARVKRLAIICC